MANETLADPQLIELSLSESSAQEDQYTDTWRKCTTIPLGITWRLADTEEAVVGLAGVTTLLLRDLAHEEDSLTSDGVKYTKLNGNERARLASAVRSLVRTAEHGFEDVRKRLEEQADRKSG
ncbi:hypothetical protein [Luteimonas sp. A478]